MRSRNVIDIQPWLTAKHGEKPSPVVQAIVEYIELIVHRLELIVRQDDNRAVRLKRMLDRNPCSLDQLVYCMLERRRLAAAIAKIERSTLNEWKLPHLIRKLREHMHSLCRAADQEITPQNSPIFPELQSPCEHPEPGAIRHFRIIWPETEQDFTPQNSPIFPE